MADEVHHPIFARVYMYLAGREAAEGEEELRREMLEGAAGRVIELGCGHGLNFALYPETVSEVLAVEPEDYLRSQAQEAAAEANVPVTVVPGLADSLPAADASFDVAVASLVLCSVPDQAAALAELRRVIRPGGELRFYEHVRGESPGFARFQRAIGKAWPHFAGGCHTDRDTAAAITAAGFQLDRCRRFDFRPSLVEYPVKPKILGLARRA